MNDNSLQGFSRERYLSRSWRLTMENGGFKTVLLLSLVGLIPIVGPLMALGGIMEHARRVSWGSNQGPRAAGPTREGIGLGRSLSTGWKVFVVLFVWCLAIGAVQGLLLSIASFGSSAVFGLIIHVLSYIAVLIAAVAALRATIYQRIVPGFRVTTVWEMVRRDFGGLMRVFGIYLFLSGVNALVVFLLVFATLMSVVPAIYEMLVLSPSQEVMVAMILSMLGSVVWPILLVAVMEVVACTLICAVTMTALGLWMRQFDVPAWGADGDPLPGSGFDRPYAAAPAHDAPPARPDVAEPGLPSETEAPAEPAAPAPRVGEGSGDATE